MMGGIVLRLKNTAQEKFMANPWTLKKINDPLYGIEGRFVTKIWSR